MAHGPLVFNEVDVEIDVDAWQYVSTPKYARGRATDLQLIYMYM